MLTRSQSPKVFFALTRVDARARLLALTRSSVAPGNDFHVAVRARAHPFEQKVYFYSAPMTRQCSPIAERQFQRAQFQIDVDRRRSKLKRNLRFQKRVSPRLTKTIRTQKTERVFVSPERANCCVFAFSAAAAAAQHIEKHNFAIASERIRECTFVCVRSHALGRTHHHHHQHSSAISLVQGRKSKLKRNKKTRTK